MAGGLEAIRGPLALPGRRNLLLVLLFVSAVAALGAGTVEGGRVGVVCGSLLVLAVAAPTVWRLRSDPLDAPGIYALVSAITLGAFSLLWIGSPRAPAPGIGQSDVARALLVVAAGVVAFGVGARLTGRARRPAPLRFPASEAPPQRLIVGLFLIGSIGLAAGLALGVLGYNSRTAERSGFLAAAQAISQLAAAGSFAVLVCALSAFGADRRRYTRLLLVLLCLQVLGGFTAGYKLQSILPALLVGFAFVACRLRIPWRPLAIGVVASVLVLAPANYVYRQYLNRAPNGPSRSFFDSVKYGAEGFASSRLRLIDSVAVIHAQTPSVYAYGNGRLYRDLPAIILVPRALWPSKPVLEDALEFSHTYWRIPTVVDTLTPITQVGDLLRNFAVVGVIVGLAIWGALLGLFAAACRRRPSPRLAAVYIVGLATSVVFVEIDLPEVLAVAGKTLPVTGVLAWTLLPGDNAPAGYRRALAWLRGHAEPPVDRATRA